MDRIMHAVKVFFLKKIVSDINHVCVCMCTGGWVRVCVCVCMCVCVRERERERPTVVCFNCVLSFPVILAVIKMNSWILMDMNVCEKTILRVKESRERYYPCVFVCVCVCVCVCV